MKSVIGDSLNFPFFFFFANLPSEIKDVNELIASVWYLCGTWRTSELEEEN